ncbi:MAG: hypothetical protein HC817_05185 [Saprospiraceae bacterium]|nr:hypothetical protein [Saprospiraceae bacterium]
MMISKTRIRQFFYLNAGIKLGEKIKHTEGVITNLYNRALIEQYNLKKENEALVTYTRALILAENVKNIKRVGRIAYGLAVLSDHQKNNEKFVEYAHKARIASFETQDFNNHCATLTALGAFYFARNKNDSTEKYLREAYLYARKNPVAPNYSIYSILGLAEFYNDVGKKELSKTYYRELVQKARELDDKQSLGSAYNSLAKLQIEQKQYTNATTLTQEVVKMRSDSTLYIQEMVADALKIQATAYEKMGNFEQAILKFKESVALSDKISEVNRGEEINLKTAKVQAALDLERKQKEVEIQSLQKRVSFVVIAFSFAIMGLAFYNGIRISRRNRQLAHQKALLEEQKIELEKLNSTKDKLFSTISHDLRAPLSSLNGLLSLWSIQALSPERFDQISTKVKYNLSALSNSLDNLLQWAYSQMKGIKTKTEVFDFQRVIENELKLLSEVSNAKSIKIDKVIETEQTRVEADFNQISIVFRNIVSNAIKFSTENSRVKIRLASDKKFLYVNVIDTGMGMTPEVIDAILTHQFIESKRGTANEKGTGFGLWLCKDFIEANKGRLVIESIEKVGTTMTFFVPISMS